MAIVHKEDAVSFFRSIWRLISDDPKPLGILNSAPLSPNQLDRFHKLSVFDFSPIRERLKKEGVVTERELDTAIYEFRRYIGLYIYAGPNGSFSMFSEPVDEVWHTLILHTRIYQEFCQATLGYFLHHNPFSAGDPDPIRSWLTFEACYTTLYGSVQQTWLKNKPNIPERPRSSTRVARATTTRMSSSNRSDTYASSPDTSTPYTFTPASCGGGGNDGGGSHSSCGGSSSCGGGSSSCGGSSGCGGGGCAGGN